MGIEHRTNWATELSEVLGDTVEEVQVGEAGAVWASPCLPSCNEAWIPDPKLRDYALNPDSKDGHDKAAGFAAVLGIQREDAQFLADQIMEGLPEAPAILHDPAHPYGVTWEVPVVIAGRNGHVAFVSTGWIVHPYEPAPQLTTARVSKRRHIPKFQMVRAAFGYPAASVEPALPGALWLSARDGQLTREAEPSLKTDRSQAAIHSSAAGPAAACLHAKGPTSS